MAFDPELVAETRAWFVKASNDIRAAEALTATSPPLLGEAAFHCQQAAEKAMKGFLTWNDQAFRKTHNLEEIAEQCLAIDSSWREEIDRAVPLSEYAWKFRYPGEPYTLPADEVAEAIAICHRIVDAALSRLPLDVRP